MPAHPQPSVPPIAASCWRRGGRLLARLLLLGWFVFGATVLLLRELVLPGIGQYRAEIAALATEALGVPVSIATLEGDWRGLHPRLHLQEVLISDAAGRAALRRGHRWQGRVGRRRQRHRAQRRAHQTPVTHVHPLAH